MSREKANKRIELYGAKTTPSPSWIKLLANLFADNIGAISVHASMHIYQFMFSLVEFMGPVLLRSLHGRRGLPSAKPMIQTE